MAKDDIICNTDDKNFVPNDKNMQQINRMQQIINDIDSIYYKYDKIQSNTPKKRHDFILHKTKGNLINKTKQRTAHGEQMNTITEESIIKRGGGIPSGVRRASTIRRHQTLGTCSTVLDQDRYSSNSRYNFFVEIWCFLLKVSGTTDTTLCNKPIRMDTNRFNYTFSFNGFIIVLRVNTKRTHDGCWQTAYSIIININPHDIHFTLFYNIYRDSSGNRCRPDESSALHISVINRTTSGKYRLYIPWEYISNSGYDAREFFISSIYKISYYLLAGGTTCKGYEINPDYTVLIRHIDSLPSVVSTSEKRTDVVNKMGKLAIDLADELNGFYRSCVSPRTFDIKFACPPHTVPHTGGNKKISKKLERYLLKQKKYIYKLKLLRKNKVKNKVKIIKQNKVLKNLKIKIKKEKAMAKEKLKKQKAKEKTKKVHITKKLKNKK
jgi:hypothetical protein